MDGRIPTPPGIQRTISSALIDLGNFWRDAGSRIVASLPPTGSQADQIRGGETVGGSYLGNVSMSLAAASDHFQALARLLRMEETFGPSIAALTRTALETLARGWWVMDAPDAAAFKHRAALMYWSEVKTAAQHAPEHMGTRSGKRGESVDAQQAVVDALAALDAVRVDSEPDRVPKYTQLVTELLEAADDESARSEYSHLSGVAHGEVFTIGGFSSPASEGSPDIAALTIPSNNLFMYLWVLTQAVDLCLTRWFDLWEAHQEIERWIQHRDRVYDTLNKTKYLVRQWNPETQQFDSEPQ